MLATRRHRIACALVLSILFLVAIPYHYQIKNTFSYITRPIWDHQSRPDRVFRHVWADGVQVTQGICDLHGFTLRNETPAVVDSVLFSTELDMLEIRWNELDSVVDKFFVVESEHTFTGLPKSAVFAAHMHEPRFARFSHKLVHHLMPAPAAGTPPFDYELAHRQAMTRLLDAHVAPGALVLMSDVDELPSAASIRLLRGCAGWGTRVHLSMRSFLYSFEWELVTPSWRAAMQEWAPGQWYGHSPREGSEVLALADAGWHCTFCFRTLGEFVTKMTGYSHADRVGGDRSLLDPARIQDTICKGGDIFNMLPEAYTWKDMIALTSLEPRKSAVGLPKYLVEHWSRFKYLLPGGCVREA